MFAAGVAGLGAFAWYERRHRESALIEPTLLRNRVFVNGLGVATAFFAAMIGMMLVASLFFQRGLGLSPLQAGLALAPLPLGIGFTAPASFALTPKFGRKVPQAGIVINAIGLALMAAATMHFGHDTTAWELVPGGFVAGLGMGLTLAPLFDFVLAGVSDQEVGSASGVLNAVQQFAGAAGLAVVGTVFFAYLDNHVPFATAMTRTALLTIVPLTIAFALSFTLPRQPREEAVA
jgi:MFS family permease